MSAQLTFLETLYLRLGQALKELRIAHAIHSDPYSEVQKVKELIRTIKDYLKEVSRCTR